MGSKKYIIQDGYAGSLGAALIASENMELLYRHFRKDYVDDSLELLRKDNESDLPICSNGIVKELYRLAGEQKMGLQIKLRDIQIRQFTIELCEYLGLSPFELAGRFRIYTEEKNNRCMHGDSHRSESDIGGVRTDIDGFREELNADKLSIVKTCIGETYDGLDVQFIR